MRLYDQLVCSLDKICRTVSTFNVNSKGKSFAKRQAERQKYKQMKALEAEMKAEAEAEKLAGKWFSLRVC